MVRADKLGLGLVVVLIAGGVALAYTGMAEPYVSQSQLPGTPGYAFAGIVVMVLVAAALAGYLDKRAWTAMGRRTALTPEGGGLFSIPDLAGTVRGMPVRARTVEVSTGGGGETGGSSTTYTVVQADLQEPIDYVAIIDEDADGDAPPATESTEAVSVGDGVTVWGDVSEELASEMLPDRAREAIAAIDGSSTILVGDPTATLLDAIPDGSGSLMHGVARGLLSGAAGSQQGPDASAVSNRSKGLVLDADGLERRLEAVAAVAEAVDGRTVGSGDP